MEQERLIGKRFGKYEIIEEIGRGGMGVVYRAREEELNRDVALKVFPLSAMDNAERLNRFQNEARALARVRHPNIVGIHETGVLDSHRFIAMDFIAGHDLARRIRGGLPSIEQSARWMKSIASATATLHEHGIIHRDLKPSNVLMDIDGKPVLTDFGIAKIVSDDSSLTMTGSVFGTPAYMSPEQAMESRDVDEASDVYSLGAILYELLTGRPPFKADSTVDLLLLVTDAEPIPPRKLNPDVPMALQQICLRCLEKKPARRYPSAAALASDLEAYLLGDAPDTLTTHWIDGFQRRTRRQPGLIIRCVVLTVVAGVLQLKQVAAPDLATPAIHYSVLSIIAIWIASAFFFQRLATEKRFAAQARRWWGAADAILFTNILVVGEQASGPELIGYPLLIAAIGLTFDTEAVIITGASSVLAYLYYLSFQDLERSTVHLHLVFLIGLMALTFCIHFQIRRVRALSRYYEN